MHEIAIAARDTATRTLERKLRADDDEPRANSDHSQPVLDLIVLRFAGGEISGSCPQSLVGGFDFALTNQDVVFRRVLNRRGRAT